jgi:hypothetical protein
MGLFNLASRWITSHARGEPFVAKRNSVDFADPFRI